MSDAVDKLVARGSEQELENIETREWLESLDYVIEEGGPERVKRLLRQLQNRAQHRGIEIPFPASTPCVNTIPADKQIPFPGNRAIERRIKSLVRWNAMAMVVRANRQLEGIGGHISTYASAATLYEVGFNHFFRGRDAEGGGDQIYFQGHASPGIYGRAFLEGRLSQKQLENFRRELAPEGGLSSYPHPWLMPDFWEFPTVSMGLGPLMAVYQARFNRYLEDRGLKEESKAKVWAFLGDGETDEPEALAALTLAAREGLDNLIFVVNCNLQRLDGPVRGNGNIIQELEGHFRGAGWNVIKVVWGSQWDNLLAADESTALIERMNELVDGQWQKYSVEDVDYFRQHFFGSDPRLQRLASRFSDDYFERLRRGGHDPEKVYAAYHAAVNHEGAPSVILAKTVKGYGLGEAGEGKNITHQQKKLNEDELRTFRTRFNIPISDDEVSDAPFYRPSEDSSEMEYLKERRAELGGPVPRREVTDETLEMPPAELFDEFKKGTDGRAVSTTMAFVRILSKLMRAEIGKRVVPIIPDEARTFGMEGLFSQFGIYSHIGQLYEPVDAGSLMYYKEAKNGQILEEGITEAGSMSSFIAAGTAYATHGFHMVPFFIYYSMFGFQRIGDLVWAAGDMRCRGFLVGGTAGRTTLNGEGLQHQDGHSHLLAYPVPNLRAYDPGFAFELAVIIRDGLQRMYVDNENVFYYLTVENENYAMPAMPEGSEEGILKGLYRFQQGEKTKSKPRVQLMAAGPIITQALKAQQLLSKEFGVAADVWSLTSFRQLHDDGVETERWNLLNPDKKPRRAYLSRCLDESEGPIVVASDYVKALPNSLARWFPRPPVCLGTDGFGRSESREALRSFFEIDYRYIAWSALRELAKDKKIKTAELEKAIKRLEIDPEKANPVRS